MPSSKIGVDCEFRGYGTYLEMMNFCNVSKELHLIGHFSNGLVFSINHLCESKHVPRWGQNMAEWAAARCLDLHHAKLPFRLCQMLHGLGRMLRSDSGASLIKFHRMVFAGVGVVQIASGVETIDLRRGISARFPERFHFAFLTRERAFGGKLKLNPEEDSLRSLPGQDDALVWPSLCDTSKMDISRPGTCGLSYSSVSKRWSGRAEAQL